MESNPQVYKTPPSIVPITPSPLWKRRLPYILCLILGLIIIGELIWGVRLLSFQKQSTLAGSAKTIQLSDPQLALLINQQSFTPGENVPVTVKLVTAGRPTDSTDIVVHFDPAYLEASGSGFIQLGQTYPVYPVSGYDNTAGVVRISGTTDINQTGFTGVGNFATLNFKAKKAGTTTVSLEYLPGSTADSNIVLTGTSQDVLAKVTNTNITISSSANTSPAKSQSPTCSGYYQYCQLNGKTGQQFCQLGRKENNQCVFDPVLTFGCGVCQTQ